MKAPIEFRRSRVKARTVLLTGVFLAAVGLLLAFVIPRQWIELDMGVGIGTYTTVYGVLSLLVSPLTLGQGYGQLHRAAPRPDHAQIGGRAAHRAELELSCHESLGGRRLLGRGAADRDHDAGELAEPGLHRTGDRDRAAPSLHDRLWRWPDAAERASGRYRAVKKAASRGARL